MHNSKNEIEQFIDKYLTNSSSSDTGKNISRTTFLSEFEENEIFSFLQNRQSFEEPDGFSLIGNTVMIFEHFEFDASKNTKKGSNLRIEIAKDRNRSIEELNKMEAKEIILPDNTIYQVKEYNSYIEIEVSKDDYISNLIKQFTSHCDKRKSYETRIKCELQNNNLVFKECFFIEDKNILHCYDIYKNLFNICLTNEFISIWRQYPEVDYIILGIKNTYFLLSNKLLERHSFKSIYDTDVLITNRARVKRRMISPKN